MFIENLQNILLLQLQFALINQNIIVNSNHIQPHSRYYLQALIVQKMEVDNGDHLVVAEYKLNLMKPQFKLVRTNAVPFQIVFSLHMLAQQVHVGSIKMVVLQAVGVILIGIIIHLLETALNHKLIYARLSILKIDASLIVVVLGHFHMS